MSLPGKLSIGFLQEDNPLKGFFRIRPAYVLEEDKFLPVENVDQSYPEDGCIRIVPDKNELTRFKMRMRQLGHCCALDLRKYPGDNEKIRSNKNYGFSGECNANIVYSDVILPVPDEIAVEILDAQLVFPGSEITLRVSHPGTRYVLVRRESSISGPWVWEENREIAGCITLSHTADCEFTTKPEAEVPTLTFGGGQFEQVSLCTNPELFGIPALVAAKSAESAAQNEIPAQPSAAQPSAAEPSAVRPAESAPASQPVQASRPAPAAAVSAASAPAEPECEPEQEQHPKAIAARLHLREQLIKAQVGINPRKGRSLSEVVDDQWRRSRYEQLGHPVPSDVTGKPLLSPVDQAVYAVNEAWKLEAARPALIERLLKNEELRGALAFCLKDVAADKQKPVSDPISEELEATRLRLMNEIDALRIRRQDMKTQLLEELKHTHQREEDLHRERINALIAERERNEEAAKGAQLAVDAAEQLLKKTGKQLEEQLITQLMTDRAKELLLHLDDRRREPAKHPDLYEPTAGELISDLRVQLDNAGFAMENDDAVNLLACMLTGGMVVISGPSGSGKSELVRQLAAALGLAGDCRRFVEAQSAEDDEVQDLLSRCDRLTPSIVMLDDINLYDSDEKINGAIRLQEQASARNLPLCLMITVQDAPEGKPLTARLLNRSFFIRLDPASAASRWKPAALSAPNPDRAVSLHALEAILEPRQELESEVEGRLAKLRRQLEEIGWPIDRRTLNELWHYCASVDRAGRRTGLQALDWALAQRALPAMLATMDLKQLTQLPAIFVDLPVCLKLMEQPLPLPAL